MVDVILYAALATVVCAMLYSVLGKDVGHDPKQGVEARMAEAQETPFQPERPVETHPIAGINDIIKADRDFSPYFFVDGAKGAYSLIIEAYALGNRDQLKSLLTPSVYAVYDQAISEREAQNLTQITDLARLKSAEITDAALEGSVAKVSVQFEAEQSSALVDGDGEVVQGDKDVLASISEVWTFERDLKSGEDDWYLSDVEASAGDDIAVDPTPDTKG